MGENTVPSVNSIQTLRKAKTMKKLLIPSLLLIATSAFGAGAVNIAGQWSVHNSIAGNESDQECKFVQTDGKLTGTCKAGDKDVQITGSLDGKKVTWKYESEYNGGPLTLIYTATVDDAKKISGSVEVQPYGVTGEFTATPSKESAK
jgi:hypothetical protein